MSLMGGPSTGTAKAALLKALREAGGVRLEASYSGGNDEGGVTDFKVFDAEGKELDLPETITRERRPGDQDWYVREDGLVHEMHPVWQAADDMLSTEFYTWAGEFSAWGTLFADLTTGKVWREGEIQSGYDSDRNEY